MLTTKDSGPVVPNSFPCSYVCLKGLRFEFLLCICAKHLLVISTIATLQFAHLILVKFVILISGIHLFCKLQDAKSLKWCLKIRYYSPCLDLILTLPCSFLTGKAFTGAMGTEPLDLVLASG